MGNFFFEVGTCDVFLTVKMRRHRACQSVRKCRSNLTRQPVRPPFAAPHTAGVRLAQSVHFLTLRNESTASIRHQLVENYGSKAMNRQNVTTVRLFKEGLFVNVVMYKKYIFNFFYFLQPFMI